MQLSLTFVLFACPVREESFLRSLFVLFWLEGISLIMFGLYLPTFGSSSGPLAVIIELTVTTE